MAHEPGTTLKQLVKLPRDTGACWPWQGQVNTHGVPLKQWNGRPKAARRWLYELLFGPVPEGLVVYGTCGAIDCVNPGHIAVGFPADVMREGVQSKLTFADVAELRQAANDGVMLAILAERHGVSPSTISDVVRGRLWKRKKKPLLRSTKSSPGTP